MMKLCLFALLSIVCAIPGRLAAQSCTDISDVDFGNAAITLRGAPSWKLHFRDAVAQVRGESPDPATVDWDVKIVSDHLPHPAADLELRLLEIRAKHLTGSGTRQYVIAFRCVNGRARNVFQVSGEGVSLDSFFHADLVIKFLVWQKGDAHCCPTQQRTVRYVWDPAAGTYKKKSSELSALPKQ